MKTALIPSDQRLYLVRVGLGLALLQHAFGAYYSRGLRRVGLGVDTQNLSGATRLYQKAGMHVHREHVTYEIELRPGKELGKTG